MNLNVRNWKEFKVGKIFDVSTTKMSVKDDLGEGNTPFISRTAMNNGCDGYVGVDADKISEGNCLTIGAEGIYCFYQPRDFATGNKVYTLRNKNLTPLSYLFIATILNKEDYKYSYGRARIKSKLEEEIIKLPIKYNLDGSIIIDDSYRYSEKGYIPDWDFMEQYIKSLNHKPLSTTNQWGHASHTLGVETWKDFYLGDLFSSVYKAKANIKRDLDYYTTPFNDSIRFISRTEMNNGCDCYVSSEGLYGIEEGNAITIGDTTATVFYQKDRFVCGDHMVICRADWINVYTAMFIISLLKKEKYRYSYGRAYKKDLILNTKIKLPATKNDYPDWSFIENYIKYLPYGDRL